MKKFLIVTGCLLLACGFVFSLYIVSRMETEDRLLAVGEITKEELTSGLELVKLIGVAVGLFILGGLSYFFGSFPVYTRLMSKYESGPLDQLLSLSEHVALADVDYVGDFEIEASRYSLYRTADDIYVIVDADDYNIQYWKGTMHELKLLEARYDN